LPALGLLAALLPNLGGSLPREPSEVEDVGILA
jgi:hypothetical protein